MQDLIDEFVGENGPGVILRVSAPERNISWSGAAGVFKRGQDQLLEPSHAFRIASMSKTITAAVTLLLYEQGRLDPDATLDAYLPLEIVEKVHVLDGVSHGASITVRQLMRHNAGLWDFAMSPDWARHILSDPGRFRSPDEILDWALDHGEPIGRPGEKYAYSDTGYVLLGHILQNVTGDSYAGLARRLVLEPLEMQDTYLEGHEEHRGPALSHTYIGEHDGLAVHGSVDWAAGGHVSTTKDLDLLLRGIFENRLFNRPATLETMLDFIETGQGGFYGLGVNIIDINDVTLWGHSGYWGSFMYYAPEYKLTITGTLNRAEAQTG